MPNVAELEKKSLFFENYYNHTFPTYRGLSGQLFSGYQLQNYDENTLVSVQEAFRKKGYHTSIVNTEPLNLNFASFLESLGFDDVVTNVGIEPEGTSDTLSDRHARREGYAFFDEDDVCADFRTSCSLHEFLCAELIRHKTYRLFTIMCRCVRIIP